MFKNIWDDIVSEFRKGNTIIWLMAICIVVFLVFETVRLIVLSSGGTVAAYMTIFDLFALPASVGKVAHQPWSAFTFIFMHANVQHLLVNMFGLYIFGEIYQLYMFNRRLLSIFVTGSIVGGILISVCSYILPMLHSRIDSTYSVGASAGIYAIIFATTALNPQHKLRLMMMFEVPIWGVALAILLLSYVGIADNNNAGGMIGHIGGALFGFAYIKALQSGTDWFAPLDSISGLFSRRGKLKATHVRGKAVQTEKRDMTSVEQKRLDEILDKISRSGYNSLSKEEKEFLFKYSNK